jgi:hypothetical protein
MLPEGIDGREQCDHIEYGTCSRQDGPLAPKTTRPTTEPGMARDDPGRSRAQSPEPCSGVLREPEEKGPMPTWLHLLLDAGAAVDGALVIQMTATCASPSSRRASMYPSASSILAQLLAADLRGTAVQVRADTAGDIWRPEGRQLPGPSRPVPASTWLVAATVIPAEDFTREPRYNYRIYHPALVGLVFLCPVPRRTVDEIRSGRRQEGWYGSVSNPSPTIETRCCSPSSARGGSASTVRGASDNHTGCPPGSGSGARSCDEDN